MIKVLDQYTIDKIAAGEVIEKPGSVVKELVENSIDAGATAVTIEIKDGGLSFIRITDNGLGIAASEVRTAFLRHATSKLVAAEDLLKISSLGFRGEALSSIAAVSQVELITKVNDALCGIRYQIHGGKEISFEEIGAPQGTTIIVRNLFYNTPARKKFMKTPATEGSYIYDLVCRIAMSHPEISFKFIMNGTDKLFTTGNGKLKDIIYHIYGRDITGNLLEVNVAGENVTMTGYLAKPVISRGNRSFENYFVNHRYIENKIISKAIEDAYRTFVMIHKFPFVVLNFDIDPSLIDVNIHPAKREMKFINEQEIYDFTYANIREALLIKELIPEVSVEKETSSSASIAKREIEKSPEPFEVRRKESEQKNIEAKQEPELYKASEVHDNVSYYNARSLQETAVNEPEVTSQSIKDTSYTQMDLFENKFLDPAARKKHRIIGQLFKTYWLIEYEDKFFIMDQHAAHEKVNFEKLMANYKNKTIISQYLMPPAVVSLSGAEAEFLHENMDKFNDLGFEIEGFGGNEYKLTAVPDNLFGLDGRELFLEFIGELSENAGKATIDVFISKLSTMACKASIKGNTHISFKEADALIDQLMKLENPYTCPHGRPTIISMTETELEKKFKRIV